MTDQLSLLDGPTRKARGAARVLDNEDTRWREAVDRLLVELADTGQPFTIEHLRDKALLVGLSDPHHDNVWGAVINAAARRKVIVKTGQWRKAHRASRHAAEVREWVGAWAA